METDAHPFKPPPVMDTWSRPASEDALVRLPVFTGSRLFGLTPDDLHETYLPDVPMRYLFLTRCPKELGWQTTGEVLLTPSDALTDKWRLGPSALVALQKALTSAILVPAAWPGVSEPSALLDALLRHAIDWERNAEIVRRRVGLAADDWATFPKLGRQFGLTRQAVHHAFHRTVGILKTNESLRLLARLWLQADTATGKRWTVTHAEWLADEIVGPSVEDRAREVRALDFLLDLRDRAREA